MTLKLAWIAKSLIIFSCVVYTPFVLSGTQPLYLAQDDSDDSSNGSHASGTYGPEEQPSEASHVTGTYGPEERRGEEQREERKSGEASSGYQSQESARGSTGSEAKGEGGKAASGYQVHEGTRATSTGYEVRGGEGGDRYYRTEYVPQNYYYFQGHRWAPYHEGRVPRGADIISYTHGNRPVYACSVRSEGRYYRGSSIAGGPCRVKIKGRYTTTSVFSIRF